MRHVSRQYAVSYNIVAIAENTTLARSCYLDSRSSSWHNRIPLEWISLDFNPATLLNYYVAALQLSDVAHLKNMNIAATESMTAMS